MKRIRFIATNNALSQKIRLFKIKNTPEYEFEIIKGRLFINGHEYFANDLEATDNAIFHYSNESVETFCRCLDSFSERPITVALSSQLGLEQVHF